MSKTSPQGFRKLIDRKDVSEAGIQRYLETCSELIPLSFLLGHGLQWTSVVSQFEIDRDKIVDLMYITKNSGQWQFVFIEIEKPQKQLFTRERIRRLGAELRQAIAQIDSWKNYLRQKPNEVVDRLCTLLQPTSMRKNPIDYKYVIIIGRNPEQDFLPEQNELIRRAAEEQSIHILTYDSVLRMDLGYGIGQPKNILVHDRQKFKFKYAQADTNMFAYLKPTDVGITKQQARWFEKRGYEMTKWFDGKYLSHNFRKASGGVAKSLVRALAES